MKVMRFALILVITVVGLTPFEVQADSVRCGVRLITEGDFKDRVLAECGAPDHVEVWEEEHVHRFQYHPRYYGFNDDYEYGDPDGDHGKPYRIKKLVIVERWTYNHGPGRFMDHLRLENGVVKKITSGDYGY